MPGLDGKAGRLAEELPPWVVARATFDPFPPNPAGAGPRLTPSPVAAMTPHPSIITDTIEKEALPTLRFASADVLVTSPERQRRRFDADRATTLGNAYRGKVDIYFQTADGATHRVATTVWAADAEHLTLKAGMALPLRAVHGFDFY